MTKRINLNEVPYEGIEVGERVMFLVTHGKNTSVEYGFYRGMHGFIPVVEYFFRELKWYFDKSRCRYIRSDEWSVCSRRSFLARGRVFGINQIKEKLDIIPTYDDIVCLIIRHMAAQSTDT